MRKEGNCDFYCVSTESRMLSFGEVCSFALSLMALGFPSAQREHLIDIIGLFFSFFPKALVASRTAEVERTICFVKSQTNNTF